MIDGPADHGQRPGSVGLFGPALDHQPPILPVERGLNVHDERVRWHARTTYSSTSSVPAIPAARPRAGTMALTTGAMAVPDAGSAPKITRARTGTPTSPASAS